MGGVGAWPERCWPDCIPQFWHGLRMRFLRTLPLIALLLAAAPGIAPQVAAQTRLPAALSADRIVFTTGYRTLNASGNVVVHFGKIRLTARSIRYDAQSDRILAEGPLRLEDGDNIAILADYADLSSDLRQGLIKSARMMLSDQMQISAVEINRSGGRYNQLIKVAASSCIVSVANPSPLWQIRASRVIQDDEKRRIYFEHARLQIGNIPIAYLPRLRVPDPRVKRASGFLVPGISGTGHLGTGVLVPYFHTLGDYADITLTPGVYSSGNVSLGLRYRQRYHNGALEVFGSIARDPISPDLWRGHAFVTANLRFANAYRFDAEINLASDWTYLGNHGIGSDTKLDSFVSLSRTSRKRNFQAKLSGFQSLSSGISGTTIPFLVADVQQRLRWQPGALGGQIGLSLDMMGYYRSSNTDIVGRDGIRISAVADWKRNWISQQGLILTTTAQVHADGYRMYQDSGNPAAFSRITPITAAALRFPLSRQTDRATEVFEPQVQLVWTPSNAAAIPNQDSQLVDFESTNLFAVDRFPGSDLYERGLRANIGFTYARHSDNGLNIDAVFGKVIRLNDLGQFTVPSGLSGTASSYVLGGQITLPRTFRITHRMVFDDQFTVTRNETQLGIKANRFSINSSYVWLLQNAAGNTAANRAELTVDSTLNLGNNWQTGLSWRYDLATASASSAGLALTYRNECIKLDLSLSQEFASSSIVAPTTSLGLRVTLEGLGGRAASNLSASDCNDF